MNSPSAAKPRLGPSVDSWALNLASFALIFLFINYYALLCGVILQIYQWLESLLLSWEGAELSTRLQIILGLVVLTILLLRFAWQLSIGFLGLVTSRYDRLPEADAGLSLDPSEQPELALVIHEVLQLVGAPFPDELRLWPTPQTFVAERRRFGVQTQRQLILVLGMPQFVVMTVTELKVILAHELANFRHRDTTFDVFFFRFQSLLYKEATRMRRRWWRWADPVYWMCRIFSEAFRRCSAPLARRRELRADAVSAAVYGGAVASRTLLKNWVLDEQFDIYLEKWIDCLEYGELQDSRENLYRGFARRWRDFSDQGLDYLEKRLLEVERTGPFDTHPTFHDRIIVMREQPSLEEPPDQRPARSLLSDTTKLENQLEVTLFETSQSENGG